MPDPTPIDIPRYLARLPMFGDLEPAELARLATGCRLETFARGDTVFRMGDPCDRFHVVVEGQVKLFVVSPDGHEKVIELIGPDGSFAEAMVFLGRPCPVNAEVLTEARLLSVARDAIVPEIERDGRLALRMLAGLSRRLHGLVTDVQAYALQNGVQRVVGYLLRDLDGADGAVTVSLPVSKATLASRLSLTPEYFSRVLRELEEAGLIEVDRRDIRLLDPARLASYPG